MAIREGLCTNCGSLMRVNDQEESTSCIFCWALVDNQEAMNLMADSEGYAFPNIEYTEGTLEERTRAMQAQGLGNVNSARTPQVQTSKTTVRKEGKLTPREKVALQNKPIVKPYCSKKHRLAIIAGVVAFVILLAAIAVPVYFLRENKKTEILNQLPQEIPFASDENRVNIQNQSNNEITLISPEDIDREGAEEVFQSYSSIYANVYAISQEDAQNKVEVRVLSENGGFLVSGNGNEVVVNDLD